jgi:hypothetical protein
MAASAIYPRSIWRHCKPHPTAKVRAGIALQWILGHRRCPAGRRANQRPVASGQHSFAVRSGSGASVRHTTVDVTDARNAPQCYPQFELTRWAAEARIGATFPAVRLPTCTSSRRSCLYARRNQRHSTLFVVSPLFV